MPSWPSSPAKNRADSSSRASKSSAGVPARSSRLVSASAVGAPAASAVSCAGERRRRRRRPATTRSTRPPAAAVAASNTSPVSISRCATCGTIRGSTTAEITAGTRPSRTSENAKDADDAATTTSQAAASPTPPARAGPADDGDHRLGRGPDRSSSSGNSRTPWSCAPPPAASARSMPGAEHPAGVVEHDHPHGVVGERVARAAARSCARIARDSALRLAGESSVSVATPRATSTPAARGRKSQPASCRARGGRRGTLGADEHRPAAAGDPGPAVRAARQRPRRA